MAALALLFQVMMPLAQNMQIEGEGGKSRPLLICTVNGLQRLGDDSGEVPNGRIISSDCPFCLAQSLLFKILPQSGWTLPAPPGYARIAMTPPRQERVHTALTSGRPEARAPPRTV